MDRERKAQVIHPVVPWPPPFAPHWPCTLIRGSGTSGPHKPLLLLAAFDLIDDDLAGLHSIRINDQWRMVFHWTADGPAEVRIVDYH